MIELGVRELKRRKLLMNSITPRGPAPRMGWPVGALLFGLIVLKIALKSCVL